MTKSPLQSLIRAEAIRARHYVSDVLNGLVPGDALYDPIYDAVAVNGGTDFSRVSDENMLVMAAAVRKLRA